MKRRFPILAKVIILGVGVSILSAGIAITVSYFNQSKRSEATYINNIDNSLDEAEFIFTSSKDSSSYVDDLKVVKKYIDDIYSKDTDRKKQSDFATFEEYADYYADKYSWLYPNSGGSLGLSEEMAKTKAAFYRITNLLTSAQLSSGSRSAFLAYYDSDKNLVMISDSRFERTNDSDPFFHVPGSFYEVKESDYFIDKQYKRHLGLSLSGYRTRFTDIIDINDENPDTRTAATLFIEYNFNEIRKESLNILKIELLVLGISSLTLVGLYALFAYLLFVKNINKLSRASSEITNKLVQKDLNEPIPISVKSNDEMRILADSFTGMEQEIINYVNIIHEEAKEKERTNAELAVASKIQLDSLPQNVFEDKNVSLRTYIKTAKEVGGDFYDYFYLDDHRLVVLISDVSGKGIPASLFMMKGKELIKSSLSSYKTLVDAIYNVNNMLVKNNKELLFITSFIAVIDFEKKEIRYINCGQEKPYIISKDSVDKLDGESNIMLGVEENYQFVQESREFKEGDALFMFTDGLNEAINDEREEFGYQRIEESLSNTGDMPLDDIISRINERYEEFTGNKEQFDDTTMLFVRCKKPELKLHYETKEFDIITDVVDQFNATFCYLTEDVKSAVGIIADELMNNIISYEKRDDLKIDVEFEINKDKLIMKFVSNGDDYDPFINHKDKYFTKETFDNSIGGFGIKIVKDLTDSHKYEYKDSHSIITLTRKL